MGLSARRDVAGRSRSRRGGPGAPALFVLYLVVWAGANWPGLQRAWWYSDDYGQDEVLTPSSVAHHLEQGRPGQWLWMLTFRFDGGADHREAANVLLRLLQGGAHALAAALAAGLLSRRGSRAGALLAGLPFLLWPENGECVLWRSAGTYPVAALFSVTAVSLVARRGSKLVHGGGAALLLVAAMSTMQLAALAGAVVGLFTLALTLLTARRPPWRLLALQGLWLLDGYIVGGAASVTVAAHAWPLDLERVTPRFDPLGKLSLVLDLNRRFFTEPLFYPTWLAIVQLLLPILVGVVVLFVWRESPAPRRWLAVAVILMGALVAPYAALLPADSSISWRVMYLAPLGLGGMWVVLDRCLARRRLLHGLCGGILLALVAGYAWLSWLESDAYLRVYEADRRLLGQVEDLARTAHTESISVATYTRLPQHTLDPYHLGFEWGGPKMPAWLQDGTVPYFFRWFSRLSPAYTEQTLDRCVELCRGTGEQPDFHCHVLDAPRLLCVCPP